MGTFTNLNYFCYLFGCVDVDDVEQCETIQPYIYAFCRVFGVDETPLVDLIRSTKRQTERIIDDLRKMQRRRCRFGTEKNLQRLMNYVGLDLCLSSTEKTFLGLVDGNLDDGVEPESIEHLVAHVRGCKICAAKFCQELQRHWYNKQRQKI